MDEIHWAVCIVLANGETRWIDNPRGLSSMMGSRWRFKSRLRALSIVWAARAEIDEGLRGSFFENAQVKLVRITRRVKS